MNLDDAIQLRRIVGKLARELNASSTDEGLSPSTSLDPRFARRTRNGQPRRPSPDGGHQSHDAFAHRGSAPGARPDRTSPRPIRSTIGHRIDHTAREGCRQHNQIEAR